MNQKTEDRIVAYIAANPDKTSAEIAEGLKLSTGTVKPKLKALAIAHKITRILADNASGVGRQEFRYFMPERPKVAAPTTPKDGPTPRGEPVRKTTPIILNPGAFEAFRRPTEKAEPPRTMNQGKDLDQIISDFAQRIAESVVQQALPLIIPKLREEMAKVVAEAASCVVKPLDPPVVPKVEAKKLPSVFIGGLQPSATSPLLKEFAGVANLRFVTPEDHANMWKSKSAHADHVIIMTGFVGHKHVEAVQCTGVKPTLVTGGMTHLRDKILELCVK